MNKKQLSTHPNITESHLRELFNQGKPSGQPPEEDFHQIFIKKTQKCLGLQRESDQYQTKIWIPSKKPPGTLRNIKTTTFKQLQTTFQSTATFGDGFGSTGITRMNTQLWGVWVRKGDLKLGLFRENGLITDVWRVFWPIWKYQSWKMAE